MDCINRLTVRMIIGLVLSLFLHLSVRAEVVSNYFVFGDDVLMEKYPQPSHLFRIELRNRAQELW
jgi:hypothetical protein